VAAPSQQWRDWLLPGAWILLMLLMSSPYFSPKATGSLIEPFLALLLPWMPAAEVHWLHYLIRKAAHFGQFVVLYVLLVRGPMRSRPWRAMAVCAVLALLSEGVQVFVPSRSASLYDVGLDWSGALFAGFARAAIIELI
jgi:VanZ family protein